MIFSFYDDNGKEIFPENKYISADILKNCGSTLTIKTSLPVINCAGYWHPQLDRIAPMDLPWRIDFTCGANCGFAYLAFFDQNYINRCSIALTNCIDDCRIKAEMNQEACCYNITLTIAISEKTTPFEIWVNQENISFENVLAKFRKLLLPSTPHYPAEAWNPVYCTWYAVHAALTEDYLENNCSEAHALGFRTFIVDDGWCFDENKRVTPETLQDWYRWIGDWQLSENKLPNMQKIIRSAQEKQMKYLFWTAPFFIGKDSQIAQDVTNYITPLHEGQRLFDPADSNIAKKTMENVLDVFRKQDLDGLKIDFIDIIPPDVERPRSRIIYEYTKELTDRIKAIKPDALIEFRQNYSTPVTASMATAFRAGDVPFDYIKNAQRCIQLRLLLGDKIPIHSDPVYFSQNEQDENVARHMMSALLGVPMISMELKDIAPQHKTIIKHYIDLYNNCRAILNSGHWEFSFFYGHTKWCRCSSVNGTVIWLWDQNALCDALKNVAEENIIICNMSSANLTGAQFKHCNPDGSLNPDNTPPGGIMQRIIKNS